MVTETSLPLATRASDGALRLDAKVSYREGKAVLSVYAFAELPQLSYRQYPMASRVVMMREYIPADTPKAVKREMLLTMCHAVALKEGRDFFLRSKVR